MPEILLLITLRSSTRGTTIMYFNTVEVHTVNPGTVRPIYGTEEWEYTIMVNGRVVCYDETFPSANAAKRAMRKKVAHERKRHGLVS